MAGDPSSTASGGSLALYRRYRPASFAEVKGQEQVTEPLSRALRAGRVSHAYLFSGPRGCGKTTSARILARSLNCVQGPTPEPCGVCESCIALAPNGPGSIDVIEIDAASHGGVDDARDLRERAFYSPVSGRFKVYIIDEAHMVTREGFNALLKLVEEPPAHLKFIFATTEPEKVIATIRSRTHHYPFRLVPPAVLRHLLGEILAKENVACEPEALQLVIRAGAGSVRDSLSVLDQLLAGSDESGLTYEKTAFLLGYTDASLLDEVTEALAAGDGAALFHVVDRVVEAGLDPRRFAADMLDRFRDLIVLKAVPDAGQTGLIDAPADRLERMAEQAGKFGQAQVTRAAEVLSDGLVQMRGATAPRLLLELMCAQVLLPGASTDSSALLARLERLERGGVTTARAAASASQPGTDGGGEATAATRRVPGVSAETRPSGPRDQGGASSGAAPGVPAETRPSGPRDPGSASSGAAADVSAETRPGNAEPSAARPRPADTPAPPRDAATTSPPAPSPAPRPSGAPVDADSLRRDWESVLEAVMRVRRVAWMLLRNATVESLADGILTVRFAREGDVKGFASSGCDADLKRVLAASFGLNVQIRALSGGAPAAQPDRDGGAGSAPGVPEISSRTVPPQTRAEAPEPPGAGQPQPAESVPVPAGPPADDGDPFDAEDPDASAGDAALTGIDLIKRELGGQIVAETDNG